MDYKYATVKLWDPEWFIVISLFFTFFPASVLYALNYFKTGNVKKFTVIVAGSVMLFAACVFFCFPLLGVSIGYGVYMRNSQYQIFEKHIAHGGKKSSVILPILLSFVFGVFVFSISFFAFLYA